MASPRRQGSFGLGVWWALAGLGDVDVDGLDFGPKRSRSPSPMLRKPQKQRANGASADNFGALWMCGDTPDTPEANGCRTSSCGGARQGGLQVPFVLQEVSPEAWAFWSRGIRFWSRPGFWSLRMFQTMRVECGRTCQGILTWRWPVSRSFKPSSFTGNQVFVWLQ